MLLLTPRGPAAVVWQRLVDAALDTGVEHRRHNLRTLISLAAFTGFLGVMWFSVAMGLTDPFIAALQTPALVGGPVLFYAAVRSRWSEHFADPALTMPQMAFAILMLCAAYAANPASRFAILLVLQLVMAFGMFSLQPAQARNLTVFTLVLFGAAMACLSLMWPEVYEPRQEFIAYVILGAVLPTIATLSSQVARLRTSLRAQRGALQEALSRLEALASQDMLTGLANRRFMLERLAREHGRMQLDLAPVCICMIDLDHFKRINDTHGHAAGDETLRRFARLTKACLREIDVLARWGGEEFVLLMPGADASAACHALARLREHLAAPAAWEDRPELKVSFSAGVAQWQSGEIPKQVLARADREAYRAKAAGRDRISCDQPEAEATP